TSKTPSYTKSVSWQHHPLREKRRYGLSGEVVVW
ncbi:transposase, partial [Shigella dysenteriae]